LSIAHKIHNVYALFSLVYTLGGFGIFLMQKNCDAQNNNNKTMLHVNISLDLL